MKEERKSYVEYNPMTGTRRDLEVEKEDGAAAAKTHARWKKLRIANLERMLKGCSEFAGEIYRRELEALRRE